MKHIHTLRFRLMTLYLLITLVPSLIMMTAMPYYYQHWLTQETEVMTEGTLTSIARNIETYLADLDRLTIIPYLNEEMIRALRLKANGSYDQVDAYTKLIANRALYATLPLSLQNTRDDILSTILVASDGSVYVSSIVDLSSAVPNYPFSDQEWYKNSVAANGKAVFISAHPQNYLSSPTNKQVFSVARLIRDPISHQHLAVIMADADTIVLERILNDISFNVGSIAGIFDAEGKVIYSSKPLSDELQNQISAGISEVTSDDDSYVVISRPIQRSQWRIVILLSKSEINAKTLWLFVAGILFSIAGVVLSLLLFSALSNWLVKPFTEMIAVMNDVQNGDLQTRFIVTGNDEIAELGNALNNMISQLNELIDREYKASLNQRNAEYRALQSQIQPHFIYNTLNGLIGLNRIGDSSGLEKMILALSNMLRYILEQEDWVRLEDEFFFIEKYCGLQQIRFRERLNPIIHCDNSVKDLKVPKLILQPLIENAVIHGIEPMARPCDLKVIASLFQCGTNNIVRISIQDTGCGFNINPQVENGYSGIANVRKRLKLAFKESFFYINSQVGQGTRILIEIPMHKNTDHYPQSLSSTK